jgi:hypothetical protein
LVARPSVLRFSDTSPKDMGRLLPPTPKDHSIVARYKLGSPGRAALRDAIRERHLACRDDRVALLVRREVRSMAPAVPCRWRRCRGGRILGCRASGEVLVVGTASRCQAMARPPPTFLPRLLCCAGGGAGWRRKRARWWKPAGCCTFCPVGCLPGGLRDPKRAGDLQHIPGVPQVRSEREETSPLCENLVAAHGRAGP